MNSKKSIAWVLAVSVHLAFLALLVFGVSWQAKEPASMEVELWRNLPEAEKTVAPEPARPKAEEPKREPRAEKKPPEVDRREAEIALEKSRKLKEEKKRIEEKMLEKKQQEDKLKEEKLKQEKLKAEKAAEDLRNRLKASAASAQGRELNEYKAKILAKIKRNIVMPSDIQGNPEAQFDVVLIPGGGVLKATLRKSSGNQAYDNAVERAILKSDPLPLPADPSLFDKFRNLNLRFRPTE